MRNKRLDTLEHFGEISQLYFYCTLLHCANSIGKRQKIAYPLLRPTLYSLPPGHRSRLLLKVVEPQSRLDGTLYKRRQVSKVYL